MNRTHSWLLPMVAGIILSMMGWANAAADEFEQMFTQKYKAEMLPELRLAKIDRFKAQGLTEAQINRELQQLADKAAGCQFKTFQAYQPRYQQVAFNALLKGGSTEDAALQLNDALRGDVTRGKITADEMSNRIKKAMELYTACVVSSGLVDQ